jgi:hypothetical protein
VDDGAVPRSEYACNSEVLDEGWPKSWLGDNGETVDASTPFLYRRESSVWSESEFTLTTVPSQFVDGAGGVCGASVNVENDETPKEEYPVNNATDLSGKNAEGNAAEEIIAPENGLGNAVDMLHPPSSATLASLLISQAVVFSFLVIIIVQ